MKAYQNEVCEHALARKLIDRMEATYRRGDMQAKRAWLMADRPQYCGIITIRGSCKTLTWEPRASRRRSSKMRAESPLPGKAGRFYKNLTRQ